MKDEAIIREKIALLKEIGFSKNKLRAKIQFYVHVDSDEEYDSGFHRCRELKKLGVNSFVMFNTDNERTQRIKDLQRWNIRKILYWLHDIADYKNNTYAPKTINSPRVSG